MALISGILDLASVATKDSRIGEKIRALSLKIQSEGVNINVIANKTNFVVVKLFISMAVMLLDAW